MMLSLDEYGSMFRPRGDFHPGIGGQQHAENFCGFDPDRKYVRHDPDDWSTRRMPPMDGEMLRALGTASTMLVMLRHADRVKIGCATGGLNDLCRTDREHAWKGACYYPFTQMIRTAKGVSLRCEVTCDTYDVPGYVIDDMNQYAGFENAATIQAAAAMDQAAGEAYVYVINACLDELQELTMDVRGFAGWTFSGHTEMYAENPNDANTYEHPDTILPKENHRTACENGTLRAQLAPASWNVFRFTRK